MQPSKNTVSNPLGTRIVPNVQMTNKELIETKSVLARLGLDVKALEEKVETMDMLTQSLKSELKKAIEDIEELSAAYDIKLLRDGLTDL